MRPARPGRQPAAESPATPPTKGTKPAPVRNRKKRRPRSPVLLIVLLTALLPILWGSYWIYTGTLLKNSLEAWVAQQRAEGVMVTHGPAKLTGFPLAVAATLQDVSAQAIPARGGWTWSTPRVRLEIAPWRPADLRIALGEVPHTLTLPRPGAPMRLTGQATQAEATVTLDFSGGPPRAVRATVRNAVVESPAWPDGPAALGALTLDYERLGFFTVTPEAASHTVFANLADLHLPRAPHGPFTRDIADAHLEATVLGPLAIDLPQEDALRAWRDAGGQLRMDRLSVDWAPLALESAGTLELDTALQPEGVLTTRVSGFMAVIDGLAAQGVMRGRDATLAKIVLGTMARPGPDGAPLLEVPVVVRGGAVWAGPIALLPLPRLPWGPPAGSLGAAGLRPGFNIDREGNVIPNR